ncbi:hypothetical protein [Paenibacillus sp. y28]
MSDERLDKLGDYFVYHSVNARYGLTFEEFVARVQLGTWEAYLAA